MRKKSLRRRSKKVNKSYTHRDRRGAISKSMNMNGRSFNRQLTINGKIIEEIPATNAKIRTIGSLLWLRKPLNHLIHV